MNLHRTASPVLNLYFSFSARSEWMPIRVFFYMLEEFFDVLNSWVVEFIRTWWKSVRECFVLSLLRRWLLVSIYKTTGAVPTQLKLFCSKKVFWISLVEEYDKKKSQNSTTTWLLFLYYIQFTQIFYNRLRIKFTFVQASPKFIQAEVWNILRHYNCLSCVVFIAFE